LATAFWPFVPADFVGSAAFLVVAIAGSQYDFPVSGVVGGLSAYLLVHVIGLHFTPLVPTVPEQRAALAKPLVRLTVALAALAGVVVLVSLARHGA
jgi:hypothetical protein